MPETIDGRLGHSLFAIRLPGSRFLATHFPSRGMEEVVVGVVGVLQLEVLEYRLNTEYNVEIRMQQLPFEQLRWVKNDPDTYNLRDLDLTSDTKAVEDMKGNRLLLFTSDWAVRWAETHNDTLELSEFGNI